MIFSLTRPQFALKQTIGALMISGCTGGQFFTFCTFPWLGTDNPDAFVIDWSKLEVPPHFPQQQWMAFGLSLEAITENEWWTVDDPEMAGNVSVPSWWHATEEDVVVSILYQCDTFSISFEYRISSLFRQYLWLASRS